MTTMTVETPPISPETEKLPYNYFGICDAAGVPCNPIAGQFFRNSTRLFEITGVWKKANVRSSIEVIEYEFPPNWRQLIANDSDPKAKFERMKKAYSTKKLLLPADIVELQFFEEKLFWWWASKYK